MSVGLVPGPNTKDTISLVPSETPCICVNLQLAVSAFEPLTFGSRTLCLNHASTGYFVCPNNTYLDPFKICYVIICAYSHNDKMLLYTVTFKLINTQCLHVCLYSATSRGGMGNRADQAIIMDGAGTLVTAVADAQDSQDHGTGASLALVHCPAGTKVWVQCRSEFISTCSIDSGNGSVLEAMNTFAGVLLAKD